VRYPDEVWCNCG